MFTIHQETTIRSKLLLLGLIAVGALSVLWALFSPYSVCAHRPLGSSNSTRNCREYRPANAGDRLFPTVIAGAVTGLLIIAGVPTLNVRRRTLTVDSAAQLVTVETHSYVGRSQVESHTFSHIKALSVSTMSGNAVQNEAPRALYFLDEAGNVLTYATSRGTPQENAEYHRLRMELRDSGLLSDGMPQVSKLMQYNLAVFTRLFPKSKSA